MLGEVLKTARQNSWPFFAYWRKTTLGPFGPPIRARVKKTFEPSGIWTPDLYMSVNVALYEAKRYWSYRFPVVTANRMSLSPSRSGYKFGYSGNFVNLYGTRYVPFREYSYTNSTTFRSFPCIERRRSDPNRISRSAAMTKFVKSRVTCQWHVAHSTKNYAIDLVIFRSLKWVEWHLPGPDLDSRSGTMNEFMKSLCTCLWHVPRGCNHCFPKRILSSYSGDRLTKFPPNPSIGPTQLLWKLESPNVWKVV